MSFCYACGYQFDSKMEVFRSTECPSCGKDVKVCLNCEYYSPGLNMDCRETISEPVTEKDKANFCEFFKLGGAGGDGSVRKKAEKARSDFNSLFGNE